MSEQRYFLDLSGRPLEGYRADAVAEALARLLHVSPQKARNLLRGSSSRIKRDLDKERALYLMNKVIACGAECEITPLATGDEPSQTTSAADDEQPGLLDLELESIETDAETVAPIDDAQAKAEQARAFERLNREAYAVESPAEQAAQPAPAAAENPSRGGGSEPEPGAPAQQGTRRLVMIAGGMALLVVVAGGAWMLRSGTGESPAIVERPVAEAPPVKPVESEAGRTERHMKMLVRSVRIWMIQYGAGFDPAQVTMQRMQQDLAIKPAEMKDGWGTPFRYLPDGAKFTIVSAGADGQFGSSDDLTLTGKARE
jgi:hypothetical protein